MYQSIKKSISTIIFTYLILVAIFVIQKPLFMLFHYTTFSSASFSDFLNVIYNGLPLDLSMAGYLTIIPGITSIISLWLSSANVIKTIFKSYFAIIALIIATTMCLDMVLYGYWGFRLDMTPIFYFTTSPSAALASVPLYYFIIGIIAVIIISLGIYWIFNKFII